MAAILHNRQWNNNLIIFSEAAEIFNLRKYAHKLTAHLNFIFKLMHVSNRIRAMASFEKLRGQIFFENCKEVWGHACLKNLKYKHSEVQSC